MEGHAPAPVGGKGKSLLNQPGKGNYRYSLGLEGLFYCPGVLYRGRVVSMQTQGVNVHLQPGAVNGDYFAIERHPQGLLGAFFRIFDNGAGTPTRCQLPVGVVGAVRERLKSDPDSRFGGDFLRQRSLGAAKDNPDQVSIDRGDRLGDGAGKGFVADAHVVEVAVRLDMLHFYPVQAAETI